MESLLSEMKQCKTVQECIDVAITDAYDEEEQAAGWLTCIQEIFGKINLISILGQKVALDSFELTNGRSVVAVCRKGTNKIQVTLESIKFQKLSEIESLWFDAWKECSYPNLICELNLIQDQDHE